MANVELADRANVPGDFFVDRNCVSCPTCRQVEPATFGDGPTQPVVVGQPQSDQEDLQALIALVSCPAGSLLYRDTYLFTGDHLSWRLDSDGLFTARQYCQYSWEVQ